MRIAPTLVPAFIALTSVAILWRAGDAAAARLVHVATPAISEHVYVSDPNAAMVFRFPVINGVIASQPDATLTIPYGAGGVSVARDGRIYIADKSHNQILIYRAGAQGREPPSVTIPVVTTPWDLVVADDGYIFARLVYLRSGRGMVVVISPRHRIVNLIPEQQAQRVALGPEGNLYVGSDQRLDVYGTPEVHPTLIRSTCTSAGIGLAVGPHGHLYIGKEFSIVRVRDSLNACPAPPGFFRIRAIVSPRLVFPALATDGARLFTVEFANHRVLQLDPKKSAPQIPIADIRSSALKNPDAIAVGP